MTNNTDGYAEYAAMDAVDTMRENSAADVEEFMEAHGIVQLTYQWQPTTINDIVLPRSYSAVLVGGRWLHGATIADILEQI
jgi:hypothetical protein